ncbi:alpha/beta hydrolase [Nonomuraea sp. NPDC050556]|uniref:alpha/beta hydrolase n=1 Tax=Nonomuraea sp. NPDC050556 TaxID=3364369 RepID=UPI0037ADA684
MRSIARRVRRLLIGVVVVLLAPVLGLAALAGSAMVGQEPAVFRTAGLAVFAAILFLGLLLCVPRPVGRWWRALRAAALLAVEGLVVWQVTVAAVTPLQAGAPPPVAGQRFWDLPTGSRLAYVRAAPRKPGTSPPVVFLHGRADLAGAVAAVGPLAKVGYDVYVYDRLGAGRSQRLADPSGYGLARDVADLDAVRQAVGAERLILIGHSDGAQVAAAYLAEHPENVAQVVFSSPSSLGPTPATALVSRLEAGQRVRLALSLLQPRALAAATLLRVDPASAHALVGDAEMDARFDRQEELSAAALHCPGARVPPLAAGAGGYTNLAHVPPGLSVRQRLAAVQVPALVIKGACDYLPWSSAVDYRRAVPGARLVMVRGAGHDAYRDQAGPYLATVRAFLSGGTLATYTGDTPPPGYLGPP